MRALALALALAAGPAAAAEFDCRFSFGCLEGDVCAYQLLGLEVRAQDGRTWIDLPGLRFEVAERIDEATGVHSYVSGIERVAVDGAERGTIHALTVFGDGEARLTTHGLGRFEGAEARGDAFARTDFGRCSAR